MRELLRDLRHKSRETLGKLEDKGPPVDRKVKTRAEILKVANENNASKRGGADTAPCLSAEDAGGERPPHPLMGGRSGCSGHLDVTRYLMEHGAAMDAYVSDGWTVLERAADGDHCSVVRYLMEHGVAGDAYDYDGWMVLERAAGGDHWDEE